MLHHVAGHAGQGQCVLGHARDRAGILALLFVEGCDSLGALLESGAELTDGSDLRDGSDRW
jgi:hypothetical protein